MVTLHPSSTQSSSSRSASPLRMSLFRLSNSTAIPRTIILRPPCNPYAQLGFHPSQNRLVALMVMGTTSSKNKQYMPLAPDRKHDDSQAVRSDQDDSSSTGWSTGSSSTSDSSATTTSSIISTTSPQGMVWLDEAWLFQDDDDDDDYLLHISLLHHAASHDGDYLSDETSGCSKFLRSVTLCKPKMHYAPRKTRCLSSKSILVGTSISSKFLNYTVLND